MIYILSYLIGCFQSGVVLSQLYGLQDPRYAGSNNIGATNMWRLNGWLFGVITFLLDGLKVVSVYLLSMYLKYSDHSLLLMSLVTLGHLYPIQSINQGGKGIACAIIMLILFNYQIGLMACCVWSATYYFFKNSGVASSFAMTVALLATYTFPNDINIMCLRLILVICLYKHRNNIQDAINEYQLS